MKKHMVNYTISGQVEFHSKYEKEHLPGIKARSAIIIASDLFYDKPEWKALRPYVASELYSDPNYWRKSKAYKSDCSVYDICMVEKPATEKMTLTAKRDFDLLVNGKYFVKILYYFDLCASASMNYNSAEEYKTEPNPVWTNTFQKLDDQDLFIKYPFFPREKPFSANAVDAIVAADIQKTPIVYLEY